MLKSKIYKHIPYGFTIFFVLTVHNKFRSPICYREKCEEDLKNIPKILLNELKIISKFISKKYNTKNKNTIKFK